MLSVPIAAWLGVLTLTQLLVTAVLAGVASVFFQTAYQVFLPSWSPVRGCPQPTQGSRRARRWRRSAARALPASSPRRRVPSPGWSSTPSTFAVSGGCLLGGSGRSRARKDAGHEAGLRAEIVEGLRVVASDGYLRTFTAFGAASNLALIGYQSILVVFLVRDLGVHPGGVGLLISGMSVGGVLGAAGASAVARRWGTARGLLLSELCTAPFALLIPLAAPGPRLLLSWWAASWSGPAWCAAT